MTRFYSLLAAVSFTALLPAAPSRSEVPHPTAPTHLEKRGKTTQLIVDGQPFLLLGGELHNSSSTSRSYLKPIWPKLVELNLNTVLAAVPWGLVEPREGKFDFALLDGLIEDARTHHLRLVLLWFGSWKNGLSHYVPDWVKSDPQRFPRVKTSQGTLEVLSPLAEVNREADARAFGAFMRHLKESDQDQGTVLMVQVENEVGLHSDARERSAVADTAFAQPVPVELMNYLQLNRDRLQPGLRTLWQSSAFKTSGSWSEVFGQSAAVDEAFNAWAYARYVNRVAEVGKNAYNLPLFVNAWIVQPEDKAPGDYPSGGPQAHVLDIWRAGAPQIDLFTPDIYLPNFGEVCAQFARPAEAFFVPESRNGLEGAANAFLAVGAYHSIGYSPFGIDGRETDPGVPPIARAYAVLRQLTPLLLEDQAQGGLAAVSLSPENPAQKITLGEYVIDARLPTKRKNNPTPERGYALILAAGADEIIVAGSDLQISFSSRVPEGQTVGLLSVEEGEFENGRWVPGRALNGDEVVLSYELGPLSAEHQSGTGLKFSGGPSLQRVKLYRWPDVP